MEIRRFRLPEVRRMSGRGLGCCVLRLLGGVLGGIEMGRKAMVGILVSRYLVLRQGRLLLVLREGRMDGGLRLLLREGRGGRNYRLADRGWKRGDGGCEGGLGLRNGSRYGSGSWRRCGRRVCDLLLRCQLRWCCGRLDWGAGHG